MLKDLPSLKMVSAMPVHSATGHDLCPVGLTYCEVTIADYNLNTPSLCV